MTGDTENAASSFPCIGNCLITLMALGVAVALVTAGCSSSAENPLPKEVRGITLGMNKADVIKQISKSGTYSEEPVPRRLKRKRLIWVPEFHPVFEKVRFDLTESDRLYAIGLIVKGGKRDLWKTVKSGLFHTFGISWEFPSKMRVRDDEVLVYAPIEGSPHTFFEFTNTKTGAKIFEIFHTDVSAVDFEKDVKTRPKPAKKQEPVPEDMVGWGEPKKSTDENSSPKVPEPARQN